MNTRMLYIFFVLFLIVLVSCDYFKLKKTGDLNSPSIVGCKVEYSNPSSRSHGCGYYFDDGRVYMFGGKGVNMNNETGYLNEVWSYDTSESEWCLLSAPENTNSSFVTPLEYHETNHPSARSSFASLSGIFSLLVFGGEVSIDGDATNDLWEFVITGISERYKWRILHEHVETESSNIPMKRSGSCMSSYKKSSKFAYLFGGSYKSNISSSLVFLNDFWSYNIMENSFQRLREVDDSMDEHFTPSDIFMANNHFPKNDLTNTSLNPPKRVHCLCWADSSDNFFVFSGQMPNIYSSNDIWMFNQSSLIWTFVAGGMSNKLNLYSTSPSPTQYYQYTADNLPSIRHGSIFFTNQVHLNPSKVSEIFFFGGVESREGTEFSDLWAFSNTLHQFKFVNGSVFATYNDDGKNTSTTISARSFGIGTVYSSNFKFFLFGGGSMFPKKSLFPTTAPVIPLVCDGIQVSEKCIFKIEGSFTYSNGRTACQTYNAQYPNADYVMIKDSVINTAVVGYVQPWDYWIGLSYQGGAYKWADGTVLVYTNWATNEPNDVTCGQIWYNAGEKKWDDTDCAITKPIICQFDFVQGCHGVTASGKCIFKIEGSFSWSNGKLACQNYNTGFSNANIVMIKDSTINSAVLGYMDNTDYWIGIEYQSGSYKWADGSSIVYDDWAAGEPNTPGVGYCGQIWYNLGVKKWDDTECSFTKPVICQYDM